MPHDTIEGNGEVPLFVRGQRNGYHKNSYDDEDESTHPNNGRNNNNSSKLQELQKKLLETNSRADEATQLNIVLEQELQSHAVKRMGLERELNDVHRQHISEMATQKAEYEILKHDYDKLQHINLKLREELLRTNRELMGVLAKKNEFKRDAERAARSAISDENRAKAELTNQQSRNSNGGGGGGGSQQQQQQQLQSNNSASDLSGHRISGSVNEFKSIRNNTPTPPNKRNGFDDPRTIRSGNALKDLSDFFDM